MSPKASTKSFAPTEKLPLPAYLKLLTSSGLAMDKAIAVSSKLYKTHNTPAALGQLTDGTLSALHVDDKELRKLVLAAVSKAGYKGPAVKDPASAAATSASALSASSSKRERKPPTKKRKHDYDLNEYLPDGQPNEDAAYGSFEFTELLDEEALMTKTVVVNRAPVMTAWAMVVAERMGFKREEALSIASVYTEMNATAKGVKLGVFEEGRGKGMEPAEGGGQPYVDFMGRNPVFSTQSSQWRALLKGEPSLPSSAYSYITNSLRQTTGHVLGAMRILADSYAPQELNRMAFGLYADFRPHVEGWGKKGEVRCEAILALRKKGVTKKVELEEGVVVVGAGEKGQEPDAKKPKTGMSVEEYEAALDEEGYDDVFAEAGT